MGTVTWSGSNVFDITILAGQDATSSTLLTLPADIALATGDTHIVVMSSMAFADMDDAPDELTIALFDPQSRLTFSPNSGSPINLSLVNVLKDKGVTRASISGTADIPAPPLDGNVNGTGTHFLTDIAVANRINFNPSGLHSYVFSINNDTRLFIVPTAGTALTGQTLTKGGAGITGAQSSIGLAGPSGSVTLGALPPWTSGGTFSVYIPTVNSALTVKGCLSVAVYSFRPQGSIAFNSPSLQFRDLVQPASSGTLTGTSNIDTTFTGGFVDGAFLVGSGARNGAAVAVGSHSEIGFSTASTPEINPGSEGLWSRITRSNHAAAYTALGYIPGVASDWTSVPWSIDADEFIQNQSNSGAAWQFYIVTSSAITARPRGQGMIIL